MRRRRGPRPHPSRVTLAHDDPDCCRSRTRNWTGCARSRPASLLVSRRLVGSCFQAGGAGSNPVGSTRSRLTSTDASTVTHRWAPARRYGYGGTVDTALFAPSASTARNAAMWRCPEGGSPTASTPHRTWRGSTSSATPAARHGFHDAARDPKTVASWWDRWPHANIGVPTGPTSRLVVVDLDGPAAPPPDTPPFGPSDGESRHPPPRGGACAATIQCYYAPVVSNA